MKLKVRLTEVRGDAMEYADLIGTEGWLKNAVEGETLRFFPDKRMDWLTLLPRQVRKMAKGGISGLGRVIVVTMLGNTFLFDRLKLEEKKAV